MVSLWLLLLAMAPEALSLEPATLGLPDHSIIVEARRLPDPAGSNRAIVLWMIAPSQNPREDPHDRLDRLVQYTVDLNITLLGKRRKKTKTWVDYLFAEAPIRAGEWHYEIDYRGRGGCLDVYDIKYQSERERFNGTLDERDCVH
jgi:hypothetical protein